MVGTALLRAVEESSSSDSIFNTYSFSYAIYETGVLQFSTLALPFIFDSAAILPQLVKFFALFFLVGVVAKAFTKSQKTQKTKKAIENFAGVCFASSMYLLTAIVIAYMKKA